VSGAGTGGARVGVLVVALAVGVGAGALWSVSRPPPARPDGSAPVPPLAADGAAGPHPAGGGDGLVVAWTPAPVEPARIDELRRQDALVWVSPVRREELPVTGVDEGGAVRLAVADGMHVPVDVVAVEPASYGASVTAGSGALVRSLRTGEALIGRRTADRWRVGSGAVVHVDGDWALRVAAVVDDDEIGGAELAVTAATGSPLGLDAIRYVLVGTADRSAAQRSLAGVLGSPVRVRARGETPFLRDADAVAPLAAVKAAFGEPAVRDLGPGRFEIDPDWVSRTVVTEDVPLLGRVSCHRAVLPALRAAMDELDRRGLGWLVDPAPPHDCWAPRLIGAPADSGVRAAQAGSGVRATPADSGVRATQAGNPRLSRHAWGIAIDLNPGRNRPGAAPVQQDELVAVMERHGFTWGGAWLRPEGAYFEHVGLSGS
jgi:hypothetical protein